MTDNITPVNREQNTNKGRTVKEDKQKEKQEQQTNRRLQSSISKKLEKYTKDYTCRLDTITGSAIKAYYDYDTNTVVKNIRKDTLNTGPINENDPSTEKYRNPTLAHELKHARTECSGVSQLPMNLTQQNIISQYDEISANITELLYVRQMLIDARNSGNKAEEQKIKNIYKESFGYYFEALEKGDIKLNANNSKEFEKEMAFIAQQTQNMWMLNFSQASYLGTFQNWAEYYLQFKDYKDLQENTNAQIKIHNANFNKAKKEMFTIGGLDFSKYLPSIGITNNTYASAQERINNNMLREDVISAIGYFNEESSYKKTINKALTPEQNRLLALHKYFVENVLTRYCAFMKTDMNNPYTRKLFEENVKFRIDDFEEVLKVTPDRWQEWKERTTVISNTDFKTNPKSENYGSNELFQKELANIYTFGGVNMLSLSKNAKNPNKLLPQHNYNTLKDNTYTPVARLNTSEKKANQQNEYDLPEPPDYTEVYKNIDDTRTYINSGPHKVKLYDFNTSNILLDRYNQIRANEGKKKVYSQTIMSETPTDFESIAYESQTQLEKALNKKDAEKNRVTLTPTKPNNQRA